MKNYCLLLFACLVSGAGFGQIVRGDHLISLSDLSRQTVRRQPISFPVPFAAAGVYRNSFDNETIAYLGASHDYAITDRFMLGATVEAAYDLRNEVGGSALQPRVRYYAFNQSTLMAYVDAGTLLQYERDFSSTFEVLNLGMGVHLPLTEALLLSPRYGFTVREGKNVSSFGVSLDFLLNRRVDAPAAVASFRKGSMMLGAGGLRINVQDEVLGTSFTLGAHYFLLDRLAVGAQVGQQGDYVRFRDQPGAKPDRLNLSSQQAAVAVRYYLTQARRLVWYTDAALGYRWSSIGGNVPLPDARTDSNLFLNLGGGVQWFLRDKLAIEFGPQVRQRLPEDEWLIGVNFGLRTII